MADDQDILCTDGVPYDIPIFRRIIQSENHVFLMILFIVIPFLDI